MKRALLCLLVLCGSLPSALGAAEPAPRLILASGCPERCENGDPDRDSELLLMTVRGERLRFITDNGSFDGGGRFSPDESQIVFTCRGQKGREAVNEICVMDVDGTHRTRLTNNSINDSDPTWSPNGNFIAFSRGNYPEYDIYRMRADGSDVRQLTEMGGGEIDADWSPDGDHIIFTHWGTDLENIPETTWVMDQDGANAHQLAEGDSTQHSPVWSPDGSKIAVYQYYDVDDARQGWQITLMKADGAHLRRLTTGGRGLNFGPHWSPSGSWITFTRGNDRNIYRVRSNGTDLTKMYDGRRRYSPSDWRSR